MATTSLNPGVGPTNADIATAVAAPSAATIAAAVAAPSAATIASAVAAPSSATIATAVAAAVPTISAINTAVATNAPSPNGWVFLGNANLQGVNSATISFSAYRKLRIVWKFVNGTGGAQPVLVRFNGDSGTNYTVTAFVQPASINTPEINFLPVVDSIRMTFGNLVNAGTCIGWMEVQDAASTSTHKQVTVQNTAAMSNFGGSIALWSSDAIYRSNSAITSVTILGGSGTNFSAGEAINLQAFQVFGAN
jgi:hypothetical protein